MNAYIEEHRKVLITAEGKTWIFKALDGSVIEEPVGADAAMTAALSDEVREEWKKKIPLRRGGKPEDIANVATFLASDLSSYVSGQVIQVDGGMNM